MLPLLLLVLGGAAVIAAASSKSGGGKSKAPTWGVALKRPLLKNLAIEYAAAPELSPHVVGHVGPSPADYGTFVFITTMGGFYDASMSLGTPSEAQKNYDSYWSAVNRSLDTGDPKPVMEYARRAVSFGLQDFGTKDDPKTQNDESRTAAQMADAVVDFWTTPALNRVQEPKELWLILLDWIDEMIDEPRCFVQGSDDEYEYQGFTMSDIYRKNNSSGCLDREKAYRRILWGAIDEWCRKNNRPTFSAWHQAIADHLTKLGKPGQGRPPDPGSFYEFLGRPSDAALATFPDAVRAGLKQVARGKILNWPGGPPSSVDTGETLGFLAKFLVMAVASAVTAYVSAGVGTVALVGSIGATITGIAQLAAEAAMASGVDPVQTHKFLKGLVAVTKVVSQYVQLKAAESSEDLHRQQEQGAEQRGAVLQGLGIK